MTDTTDDQAPEPTPDPEDTQRSLRRRVADRWNSLNVAGKAVVIGGVVITVVGGIIVLAGARRSSAGPECDDDSDGNDESNDDSPVVPELIRRVTNHIGGYVLCSHGPCTKKMRPSITGHDCCGRCRTSRSRDCSEVARRDYDGPGGFAHDYFEGLLFPGVCVTCGEPPEGHWVLDGAATRLL